MATLTFLGAAAGQVTGSRHLVESEGTTLLLDAGLFQGTPAQRARNRDRLSIAPRTIDAVVLSHAHPDPAAYLPVLVREGFTGPIHCTRGTAALARILLRDAARIAEEDTEHARRHGYSTNDPPEPLFTVEDAEAALARLEPHPYGVPFHVGPVLAQLRRAGHILGSAIVEVDLDGMRLVYTGDLGRPSNPLLRPPETVKRADVLLVESTYGDRDHPTDAVDRLATAVGRIVGRGGVAVIPSFAIGRAQEILWHLRRLEEAGRIPSVPTYLDSPMATDATEVFCHHPEDHGIDMALLMNDKACPLCTRSFRVVRSREDSKAVCRRDGPAIVIAGSGMLTGGRVLHHLARRLPDARNGVILVGFQAASTRGRTLRDGATTLHLHGQDVPVAAEVITIDGLSAHADRTDMLRWISGFDPPPQQTYLVHGEPPAITALTAAIRGMGWSCRGAEDGEIVELPAAPTE